MSEEQWAKITRQWIPKGRKRQRGRLRRRWRDELDSFLEDCPTTAQDREKPEGGKGGLCPTLGQHSLIIIIKKNTIGSQKVGHALNLLIQRSSK